MMRPYLALVDDLYVEFDPAVHCDPAQDGFAFTMRETESQIAEVEMEIRQSGLAILASLANRNVLLSWTRTGNPEDAELIARGYIAPDFSRIYDLTQTIRIVCGPRDVEVRKLAYAKKYLANAPDTDSRFSDFDSENPDCYLLGRSVTWHVDPLSHNVSVTDELEGEGVHHLEDLAFGPESDLAPVSSGGTWGYPVKTVRFRVSADWTQEAAGVTNIANSIGVFGRVETLDPDAASRISQSLDFEGAEGWSLSTTPTYTTRTAASRFILMKDSRYESEHRRILPTVELRTSDPSREFVDVEPVSRETIQTLHDIYASFEVYTFEYDNFPLAWSYTQDRREELFYALDVPLQPNLATMDTATPIELSLKDPFRASSIPDYEENEAYQKGDYVYRNNRYYRCVADHFSENFAQIRETQNLTVTQSAGPGFYFQVPAIYWEEIFPPLPRKATTVRLFDYAGGTTSLVTHIACRARKEARRMLRVVNITVATSWIDGIAVSTLDDAIIRAPDGRPMRGKVIAVERVWSGGDEEPPIVKVMVGVPMGTGDYVPTPFRDPYCDLTYADDWIEGEFRSKAAEVEELNVEGTAVRRPVEVNSLTNGNYAVVQDGRVVNDADDQLRHVNDFEDPTEASLRYPTHIKGLTLRSLQSGRTFERQIDVLAKLLVSPTGYLIDG